MSISRVNKRMLAVLVMLTMIFSLAITDVNAASKNKITLTKYNVPANHIMGRSFSIKGKIKARQKISTVTIGVVSAKTGKWKLKYKKTGINRKSYKIKKADPHIKFGKLKAGTYYYRIKVKLKGKKTKTILNRKFEVIDNRAESVSLSVAEGVGVNLSGVRAPGTYMVGKEFTPTGIVSCDSTIKKVEVGIVLEATNKWTQYKYTAGTNATDFDLSRTATALKFNELPAGVYRYRMYAHTDKGIVIAFNKEFTVKSSGKPQQAVNWAICIANDNSFTYGEKPIANQQGCYFCGNNDKKVAAAKKKKMANPERYEKTYVCLTFAGAAYAHGAGDPEILKACQKRYMTMYETNDNFKKFSCWMKIGSCKELTVADLLPGDIIVKWSDHNDNSGHICIYIGGNDIVESSGGGWGANSIAVKKDVAAKRLTSLSSSSKNYVMRYRH